MFKSHIHCSSYPLNKEKSQKTGMIKNIYSAQVRKICKIFELTLAIWHSVVPRHLSSSKLKNCIQN